MFCGRWIVRVEGAESLSQEEPCIRPAGSDTKRDGSEAVWASALIGGSRTITVDPRVDLTAVEVDADPWPSAKAIRCRVCGGVFADAFAVDSIRRFVHR